jgi:hypothetical protein
MKDCRTNRKNERNAGLFSRSDDLPEVAPRKGGCQLALCVKLAKRAGVRVVDVFDTGNDAWARHACCKRCLLRCTVLVLATQELMQALPKEHHPGIEDEHRDGEERL